jgi:hypothetical protein
VNQAVIRPHWSRTSPGIVIQRSSPRYSRMAGESRIFRFLHNQDNESALEHFHFYGSMGWFGRPETRRKKMRISGGGLTTLHFQAASVIWLFVPQVKGSSSCSM